MTRHSQAGANAPLQDGLIVANYGRHLLVETPEKLQVICHARGKKNQAVVGDRVKWLASQDQGTIEQILHRRNLLFRQDESRTKSFAANLDQVLILLAGEPAFSNSLLSRALIAAHAQDIAVLIVLNKRDLESSFERAWQRLLPYQSLGYQVLSLSAAKDNVSQLGLLRSQLSRRTTLLLGPSGAGKSTLINRLIPNANAQTGALSQALNTGRHTTTRTSWFWVNQAQDTALIDSPGFQEFGLNHIEPARLAAFMPDIAVHAENCRFYNCTHLHEPGCGVLAAASDQGQSGIDPERYAIYVALYDEISIAKTAGQRN